MTISSPFLYLLYMADPFLVFLQPTFITDTRFWNVPELIYNCTICARTAANLFLRTKRCIEFPGHCRNDRFTEILRFLVRKRALVRPQAHRKRDAFQTLSEFFTPVHVERRHPFHKRRKSGYLQADVRRSHGFRHHEAEIALQRRIPGERPVDESGQGRGKQGGDIELGIPDVFPLCQIDRRCRL